MCVGEPVAGIGMRSKPRVRECTHDSHAEQPEPVRVARQHGGHRDRVHGSTGGEPDTHNK